MVETVILAQPRGFCAGVERAISTVQAALAHYERPVYVLHEIVHNTHVIAELERKGAIFVECLEEVPTSEVLIFSAHGVSKAVEEQARQLGLRTIDATCPLVSRVHRRVATLNGLGCEVLVIGHKGHPEVEGTCGHASGRVQVVSSPEEVAQLVVDQPESVGYVTQTTLSIEDTAKILHCLCQRFPQLQAPKETDICYATTNRQKVVRELAGQVDLVLVVGSKNSSNSNRLREVADQLGTRAYLIDRASEIDAQWLVGVTQVGVTAGASAPECLVEEVVSHLRTFAPFVVQEFGNETETIRFRIPQFPT